MVVGLFERIILIFICLHLSIIPFTLFEQVVNDAAAFTAAGIFWGLVTYLLWMVNIERQLSQFIWDMYGWETQDPVLLIGGFLTIGHILAGIGSLED